MWGLFNKEITILSGQIDGRHAVVLVETLVSKFMSDIPYTGTVHLDFISMNVYGKHQM